MYRTFFLFLIGLIIPTVTSAQDYLWPTDASPYLTSSFGEYRSRHFHAGIDIKTWNQSGYKAIAIEDGYIWRIRTSNTGYGKALYLKLKDGRIAVYAHLQRFTEEIRNYVYELQDEQGRYELDQFLRSNQFSVNKGDVIAYTGNTGTRHPHLHFEIRSPKNEPVNPLSLGLSIEDNVAPTPQVLAVAPLSRESKVNGNYFLDTISLHYTGKDRFRAAPVTVSGPFGLEIKAYDGVDRIYNKYSVYSVEIFLGDSSLFRFQYDQFSFSETGLITVERNYGLKRLNYGRYQKLYKTTHTQKLPFYENATHGQIRLPTGEHTLRIVLKDYNGNTSEVEVPVQSVPASERRVYWTIPDSGKVICTVENADSTFLSRADFQSVSVSGNTRWTQPDDTLRNGSTYKFSFPGFDKTISAYVLRNQLAGLSKEVQYPFGPDITPPNDFTMDWIFSEQGMIARIDSDDPIHTNLRLETLSANGDTSFQFYTHDLKKWNTAPIPPELLWDQAIYVSSSNTDVIKLFPNTNTVAGAGGNIRLSNKDNSVELSVFDRSLYYPSLIWFANQDPMSEDDLSPVYSFYPRTIPFRNSASVRIKVPEVPFPKRQVGIYYSEDKSHWNYLPAEFNADSTALTGEILSLESFTLRRDSIPPSIYSLRPKDNQTYYSDAIEKFTFRVFDTESGIAGADNIKLLLDESPVIFEFNPITRIMTYWLREPLSSGTHTISLTVKDAAGNTMKKRYNFNIR